MSNGASNSNAERINVLTLDGGGIRGLSSLLILKELMVCVNNSITAQNSKDAPHNEVQPHHIFNLVAGTSTGGLIAIMLGKLGMTVDECIEAYEQMASHIFGKKHLRARFTGGLGPAKYSGSGMMFHVHTLLQQKDLPKDLRMYSPDAQDKIACAVICRELENESRYSNFLPNAVCICSIQCRNQVHCQVCEAARATSAAPTFFPVQTIDKKHFVDGGMEFNNPSYEIWNHYSQYISIAESQRRTTATEIDKSPGHPGGLDLSEVRFINLGTGDKPKPSVHHRRDNKLAKLIPAPIRMALSLKNKLTDIAVNSERVAAFMQTMADATAGRFRIEYVRFSADNGVCFIKMDKYKKIKDIKRLTLEYLETPKIQRKLRRLGNDIANDYLAKQSSIPVQGASDPLSVPEYNPERPQWQESSPSLDTVPSTDMSTNANSSIENTPSRHSSMNTTSSAPSPILVSSPSQKNLDVAGAEEISMIQ